MSAHIIIDTGRNGVPDERQDCAHWCNNRGAGAGHASTALTEGAGIVDAYFYLKTPGESDGCTETLPNGEPCPRFDTGCGSPDAIGSRPDEPRAPEAGAWFDYQVKQLAEKANFGDSSAQEQPAAAARDSSAREHPTTAAAAPKSPSPPVATSPEAPVTCCWGTSCDAPYNCASVSEWCSQSAAKCKSCGGLFCAAPALAAIQTASPVRKHSKRQRFLAVENAMLQKHMHKRAALARRVTVDEL